MTLFMTSMKRAASANNESSSKRHRNSHKKLSHENETTKTGPGFDSIEQKYVSELKSARSSVQEGLPIKRNGKVERVLKEFSLSTQGDDYNTDAECASSEDDSSAVVEVPVDKRTPKEKLQSIKEDIAQLATGLIEDPEENVANLTRLIELAELQNFATSQLAILASVPVFKSLAPAYQIRPLSEAEQKEKASKDVLLRRKFEQNFVLNYQRYISLLTRLAKTLSLNSKNNRKISPQQVRLGNLALKSSCDLCNSSLRHFNFREELFTILIRRLNRKPEDAEDLALFHQSLRTLENLLKDDREHGMLSAEIVKIMSKVIRDKKFRVDEAVLNIFLSLSLLDDFDPSEDKHSKEKLKKKDRAHLSKKQKKARKEAKSIEIELKNAELSVTAEQREKFQSQTLKAVLSLYLEILKANSASDEQAVHARLLTAPVMEGITRFGRMLNFDLLGEFLVVLREIMADLVDSHSLKNEVYMEDDFPGDGGIYDSRELRKILLCISAAFSLLLNHREVGKLPMAFDLLRFISMLYAIIADLSICPDLEFSHKSLRLADPLSALETAEKPSVNVSTNAELFLRCLDLIFFKSKNGTLARSAAFTKRVFISSLQMPEKSTIACLKFVLKLVNKFGDGLKGLWGTDDTLSIEGNYVLGIEQPNMEVELERCNVGSAVLWENVILDKHYNNVIKDGSRSLLKASKNSNSR